MKNMAMLLRREIWEHPAFYVAPLVLTAVFSLGFAIENLIFERDIISAAGIVAALQLIEEQYRSNAYALPALVVFLIYNLIMVFVIGFYLMDCLYAERKDRSILFWKSLPVSDTTTVASKMLTAMITIPLITLVVFLVAWFFFLVVVTVVIWIGGGSAWSLLWKHIPWFQVIWNAGYLLLVQSLWFFPFMGWVALASAWARRMPFLWVVLVPLAISIVEVFVFKTRNFLELIGSRFVVLIRPLEDNEDIEFDWGSATFDEVSITDVIDPTALLTAPGLWGGLLVGTLFLAGAVWLRRYRDDS